MPRPTRTNSARWRAPHSRATLHPMTRCSIIVAAHPAPPRRLPLDRKTASRGLSSWPRLRVGRAVPQPAGVPWKNRPHYDAVRRGAVLPQSGDAALAPNQIDDIVVTAARHHQVGGVNIDFRIPYPQEQLWVMYGADDFSYLGINGKATGSTGTNRGTPPRPGYQAIIHTHPSWAEYGPGPGDFGHPVPLYGIAPDGVWVVRPGATSATGLYGLRP